MAKIRLMDTPADFTKLGVSPDKVEPWEDGRRNQNTAANNWEWWYSDFIFDDGSTAVVQFFTKAGRTIQMSGDHPAINIRIKLADGTELRDNLTFKTSEVSFDTQQCNVIMCDNCFIGDLHTYHIKAHSPKGFGVDVTLTSQSKPYRPGTAYFEIGKPEDFYTWLCVVPTGTASGTLMYQGKTHSVQGTGYHDHQWGSTNFLTEWNHWVWARQRFEGGSLLVFDLVGSAKNDYARIPLAFVQDMNGNLLFENTKEVQCSVLGSYKDEVHSGKNYPNELQYVFEQNGKRLEYHLKETKILEAGGLKSAPLPMKLICRTLGIHHSYTRYLAQGDFVLTDGSETMCRSSELIYEFMYPGDSFEGHMENTD